MSLELDTLKQNSSIMVIYDNTLKKAISTFRDFDTFIEEMKSINYLVTNQRKLKLSSFFEYDDIITFFTENCKWLLTKEEHDYLNEQFKRR